MDVSHIRQIDGTLLLVFQELLRERRATAAAARLGLTQSGISHALNRLRLLFGDELFLRRPHGLEPTARALAMATYRSPEEFVARFRAAPRMEGGRPVFPVEEYLQARGRDYAQRTRPESFICLSESIDLHRVDASRIFTPVTAIAVREDQLVPLGDMRAMVARLPNAELHEISSVYGHDAFLKENRRLAPIFANVLSPT